jgi:hypothetical protein
MKMDEEPFLPRILLREALINLVGGIPTPLKNIKVSWDDDILQYIESHEKSMVSNHQSASK